ncbi:MAG: hypothetical protein U1E56_04855 [Bauldia sp.]
MAGVSNKASDMVWAWTVAGMVLIGAWGLWSGFAASQFWFPPPLPSDRLQATPYDLVFIVVAIAGAAVGGAVGAAIGRILGQLAANLTGRS